MIDPIISEEHAGAINGVAGRFFARTIGGNNYKPGTFTSQRWISAARPIDGYGADAVMRVEMRFDDNCRNGHNDFAITAEVRRPRRSDIEAGGAMHEEIARVFPELAPLVKWHLTGSDGPMHYVANTVYLAGDRDYRGLRAGETRPLLNGRTGEKCWELVAVTGGPAGLGVAISDTETGRKFIGAETVPLYILKKDYQGETPPVTPRLEWRQSMIVGEGKARELDAARRVAVWPGATDAELSIEPAELRAALEERLPALLAAFRADIEAAGFVWAPPVT